LLNFNYIIINILYYWS